MVDSESSASVEGIPETSIYSNDFQFPKPPELFYTGADISTGSEEDWNSSGDDDVDHGRRHRSRNKLLPTLSPYCTQSSEELPPIGFFWDIENCQVPRGCSAVAVVSAIRNAFLPGRREAEFTVVCDARKELPSLLQDLNDAQVNLLHVCATQKNAADDKLRQCMRRYAELHATLPSPRTASASTAPPALLLISGDVNFAADLSDFRHRKRMEVILVHKNNTSKALMACSSQHHCFTNLTARLPRTYKGPSEGDCVYCVEIVNVPTYCNNQARLSRRLRQIADNCGGRVMSLKPPFATLRFQTHHQAHRALKRMDGEDVYGHKITVIPPIRTYYNGAVRSSSDEGYQTGQGQGRPLSAPPVPLNLIPPTPNFPPLPQSTQGVPDGTQSDNRWSNGSITQACSDEAIGNTFRRPVDRTPTGFRSIKGTHGDRHTFNRKNSCGYRNHMYQPSPSPSPSPAPSQSPRPSASPSPSPSPTLMDLNAWNTSERSISEHSSEARSGSPPGSPPYVDITVTNLEHSSDPTAVRSMLHRMFSEHVPVLEVSIRGAAETLAARVRVSGVGNAQLAVARLHRRRVGGRRLVLSLAPPPPALALPLLRRQVACLLQAAPDQQLPLFRLRELYAARHGRTLPAAEVSRLRDTCLLIDSPRGRSVRLLKAPPQPPPRVPQTQDQEWWSESECCPLHGGPETEERSEGSQGGTGILPICTNIPNFTLRLQAMLSLHGGVLLINSFPQCYQTHFGEPLPVDAQRGVPLEHIISSIRGVALRSLSQPRPRKLVFFAPTPAPTNNEGTGSGNSSSAEEEVPGSLAALRSLLARELLDLLRTAPRCQMPFSRLIPSYHLHFGRQCRVADYGFTRLADLLDSLSHTVQVMGEGSGRMITLSHQAQMKRFTADLLKVLRALPDKTLMLSSLPELYRHTLNKEFDPVEYGVCHAEDLVAGVARNCVALGPEEGRISLPRHRQTPEEAARIRHFASQAAELLRHAPNCRLELSRFVPAYHTHFGRQLRVSHYGLPKVQDLFHAIPDTVDMWLNEEGERVVALRCEAARRVLASQVVALPLPLSLTALPHTYRQLHGHGLLPHAYGADDLLSLLNTLPGIKLVEGSGGIMVMLSDPTSSASQGSADEGFGGGRAALLAYRVLAGDRCVSQGGSPLQHFCKEFQALAHQPPPIETLKEYHCIKVVNNCVLLTLLWRCVGRLVALQGEHCMSPSALASAYKQHYQHPLPCDRLGFSSVESLIEYCGDVWEIQGGLVRVRPGLSTLLPPGTEPRVELLPNTPPGQKPSSVWSTPPAVASGPWAAPAPCMLPLPAPQLLGSGGKRRVRLAAQFDSPA